VATFTRATVFFAQHERTKTIWHLLKRLSERGGVVPLRGM
jgi:hypothetical protein